MSVVRIVLRQKTLDCTTPNIDWFFWPPCPPPPHPNNKHWTSTPAGKASAHRNWLDDDSIIWMQSFHHHELFVDIFDSMALSSLITMLGFEHERMPEAVNPHIPTISTTEFPRNAASGAWLGSWKHPSNKHGNWKWSWIAYEGKLLKDTYSMFLLYTFHVHSGPSCS